MRAVEEEEEDSERTRASADLMESRRGGLRRCSSLVPVRVRMKMLPRFSKVHIFQCRGRKQVQEEEERETMARPCLVRVLRTGLQNLISKWFSKMVLWSLPTFTYLSPEKKKKKKIQT